MKSPELTVQFTSHRRVEFCETDMAGIVHFSNFYRYMEQAEHAYFRSLDLDIMQDQPDGSKIGWPRVSCKCRFKAPAYYDDVLEIRTSVVRKGVKSLTFQMDFWREDTWVARGQTKTVCCRITADKQLESIEIPVPYSERIEEAVPVAG